MSVTDFIMGTDPEFKMTPQSELGRILLDQLMQVYGPEGVWALMNTAQLYDNRMNSLYDQAGSIQPVNVKIGNTVIPMKGPGRKDIALQAGLADQHARRSIDPALNMGMGLETSRRGYTTPRGTGLMDVIGPALANWAGNGFKNPFKSSPTTTGASGAGTVAGGGAMGGGMGGANAQGLANLGIPAATTAGTATATGAMGGGMGGAMAQGLANLGIPAATKAAGATAAGGTAAGGTAASGTSALAGAGTVFWPLALMAAMGVASKYLAKATDSSHTPQTAMEAIESSMAYLARAKEAERIHGKGGIGAGGEIDPTWDNRQMIKKIAPRASLQYPGYDLDSLERRIRGLGYDDPFAANIVSPINLAGLDTRDAGIFTG